MAAATHKGFLLKAGPARPGGSGARRWERQFFVLDSEGLMCFSDEHENHQTGWFTVSEETRLLPPLPDAEHPFSLRLAKGERVVATLAAESDAERLDWVIAVEQAVDESCRARGLQPPTGVVDLATVAAAARALAADDVIYDVTYSPTDMRLGVSLARVMTLAVVASSEHSTVLPGSVLWAVNGDVVALKSYQNTMAHMKAAEWPLRLTFRRAADKRGSLEVRLVRTRGRQRRRWKRREFVLENGEARALKPDGALVAALQLQEGSVVPVELPDAPLCLLLTGTAENSVLLRCETREQLLEWAAACYHQIALASGGHYLLEMEAARVVSAAADGAGAGDLDVDEARRYADELAAREVGRLGREAALLRRRARQLSWVQSDSDLAAAELRLAAGAAAGAGGEDDEDAEEGSGVVPCSPDGAAWLWRKAMELFSSNEEVSASED